MSSRFFNVQKVTGLILSSILSLVFCTSVQAQISEGPSNASFWDDVPLTVLEGSARGDIYWIQQRHDAPEGSQAWNMIYVTEGVHGQLEYVSGEIYIPRAPSAGPRKLIIWGIGTPGFQDSCAPSRNPLYMPNSRVPGIEALLARGYVVVMSDYQGLGTPGAFAYLQGEAQAKSSLDAARAARKFPLANVGTELGVYGFSQGGQTALWVSHLARDYAPEFTLVGAVPIAPAARHLDLSYYDLGIPENSGYFITRMAGLQVGHPELRLRDILTEAGLELLTAQAWGCYEIFGAGAGMSEPYAKAEALDAGPWRERLEENDDFLPIPASIPVFIIQGDADIDVPVELTREVNADLCAQGNQLEYLELPGLDHSYEIQRVAGSMVADWFSARFNGEALNNYCEQ